MYWQVITRIHDQLLMKKMAVDVGSESSLSGDSRLRQGIFTFCKPCLVQDIEFKKDAHYHMWLRKPNIINTDRSNDMQLNKSFQIPFPLALLIILVAIFSSCSPKINSWSQASFSSPEIADIESLFHHNGIALLPVIVLDEPLKKPEQTLKATTAARGPYSIEGKKDSDDKTHKKGSDSYRVILSEILLGKIKYMWSAQKIVSPADALMRLNDNGLSQEYSRFNSDFSSAGFNSSLLKSFGDALNCRYIFISQAVATKSESDASLTIVWSFGRKSLLYTVKYHGQIWDVQSKRQVWEGLGVASSFLSSFENQPVIEEMASQAADSMLKTINSKSARR